MKSSIAALGAGIVFGVGLGLSGMTQPRKVLGFLDVSGAWDPSLMFVMGGAILVHFALARWIRRRERPLLETRFHVPTTARIDSSLVVGSALFGIGWGLGGYCPGPAIVSLGSGALPALVFVGAMALGMALHYAMERTPRPAAKAVQPARVQPGPSSAGISAT